MGIEPRIPHHALFPLASAKLRFDPDFPESISDFCEIPDGYFDRLGIGGSTPASPPPPDDPDGFDNSSNDGSPPRRRTEDQASPALKGDPWHPEQVAARVRPPYRMNPARDPRNPNYNPSKTSEPADAAQVYANSVRGGNMHTWYGRGANGQYYRFFHDNAGGVHFSGYVPRSKVPADVIRILGQ